MFWHMCVLVCIYMYWYQYVHKQYQQLQYRPIRAEHMQIHNILVILVCIDPIYGSIHTKIRANTYPIRTNTTCARRKPVCQRGFKYIPKHTKTYQKHTKTYHKTYQYGFTLTPAAEMLGWYWYVLWSVFACFHWQTRHDTYQYQYMTAQVVLACIDTCIRYVFVRITRFVLQIRYDTYFCNLQPQGWPLRALQPV